jgi:type II secretory pathway component PulF
LVKNVVNGMPLHTAMRGVNGIPQSASKFAEIGEKSGSLGDTLEECARIETQDFINSMERRVSLIRPISIVFLGISLLWLVVVVILPLYEGFDIR